MLREMVRYPLDIDGVESEEFVEVKSPFSGEPVAAVGQADEKAIDAAIAIAQKTFSDVMSKMPAHARSEILRKTSEGIKENLENLAATIALEGGKPIKDARGEVNRAVNTFAIASEEALRLDGEQLPMDRQAGFEGRIGLVIRQPIGIIAGITPFNFPINLVAHKVAPAIAGGNTVVLKPSSQTPVSSFKLLEIMIAAGLPRGALQIIPCKGANANTLVSDPRIAMLTFTGSPAVGWNLRKHVAPGVRMVLELGGNAGMIVHDDADIDLAVKAACRGGYANAGQTCISVQRVYAHKKVYDRFLKKFVDAVTKLKVGDPCDDSVDVGPLIDRNAVKKTTEWIEEAVKKGAKIAVGGKHLKDNLVEPTVVTDTSYEMNVVCSEVFGPVVAVMKYATIDEAIEKVNDEKYGLQSGIFTRDLEIAFKAARRIDAGGVMINDAPTFRADHMPYGGRKHSGLGLEGVRYALHEMTQPKFVCFNLPPLA